MGRLGRWILRLAHFNFRAKHTCGVDNVVADVLSRVLEGYSDEAPETNCVALLQFSPLIYSSLEELQKQDPFCVDLRGKTLSYVSFLFYDPKGARRRRWIVPVSLRPMLLEYFHDSVLSGLLGALNTFQKTAGKFYWPKTRAEIFDYVHQYDLLQRLKPAQNTRVGLNSARPFSETMKKFFTDFMGPLTCPQRGNIAILVVLDTFSKFVSFFPCPENLISGCV